MWIGKDQTTGATGLYRQPFAGVTELVSPVDEGVRLIGWTDHGLVTANDLGPPVTVTNPNGSISTQSPTITELRDLAGTVVARAVAEPLRTAPVGRIIALGTSRAFDVAEIEPPESALALPAQHVALEATAGTLELVNIPVPEALSDGELMFSVIEPWSLSNDGEWAARVTAAGVSTALVVERISSQTRRVLALRTEGERATVGFSQDGAWFFTYSPRAGELTATTMGASATFSIDFDQRIRFGGVYIRQTPGG